MKLDRKAGMGFASCKVCGQSHQSPISFLDQAVDVYANWVDAAEEVNKAARAEEPKDYEHVERYTGTARNRGAGEEAGGGGYDVDDGFVVDDEMDGNADFDEAE